MTLKFTALKLPLIRHNSGIKKTNLTVEVSKVVPVDGL
ncbi:hypothetical protein PALB_8400 [Pseudoalteromonas luteoviolacea B = ATCC 29581]|nr:hypothetical protein PALB_8400 [Pseudoalteromonas luteoviolacea B = ATCC 29581]